MNSSVDHPDLNHRQSTAITLDFTGPLAWPALVGFLVGRSSPRMECLRDGCYVRTVQLGAHSGWISVNADDGCLHVEASSSLMSVLPALRVSLRRLFDLDADPLQIDARLSSHPRLAAMVAGTPGLRVPGTLNGFELALRAVIGQQISVKSATTVFGRFVERFGQPIDTPFADLDRLAPRAEDIAQATLPQLIGLGLTGKRAQTVHLLAQAVAQGIIRFPGSLAPPSSSSFSPTPSPSSSPSPSPSSSADAAQTRAALLAIPGIGPWTTEYIAMRALADPDAFPASDLALLKILGVEKPAQLLQEADAWRPWRAYAAIHVWHSSHAGG